MKIKTILQPVQNQPFIGTRMSQAIVSATGKQPCGTCKKIRDTIDAVHQSAKNLMKKITILFLLALLPCAARALDFTYSTNLFAGLSYPTNIYLGTNGTDTNRDTAQIWVNKVNNNTMLMWYRFTNYLGTNIATGGGSATNVFFGPGTNTSWRVVSGTNVVDVSGLPTFANIAGSNFVTASITNGLISFTDATNRIAAATNGLGSAAFNSSSAYDTNGAAAYQAKLATNGLGTAAFTASSAYDAAGAATAVTNTTTITRFSTNVVTSIVAGSNVTVSYTTNASGIAATVNSTASGGSVIYTNADEFGMASAIAVSMTANTEYRVANYVATATAIPGTYVALLKPYLYFTNPTVCVYFGNASQSTTNYQFYLKTNGVNGPTNLYGGNFTGSTAYFTNFGNGFSAVGVTNIAFCVKATNAITGTFGCWIQAVSTNSP